LLTAQESLRAKQLCGKLMFSSLWNTIDIGDLAEQVFVATGDIGQMWIWETNSVVQMTICLCQQHNFPWLRFLVEGAIRRNAFNILQDPHANGKIPTCGTLRIRLLAEAALLPHATTN
jgi:meiotically up-regulated gene 157 (Mug157) protein